MMHLISIFLLCLDTISTHTVAAPHRLRTTHHRCIHDSLTNVPTHNASTRSTINYIIPRAGNTIPRRRQLNKVNLRFHIEYSSELTAVSASSTNKLIVENFIPRATEFWSSALQVAPVAKLSFQRNCTMAYNFNDGTSQCHTYSENFCGTGTIPAEWLQAGKTCENCRTSGSDSCTGCIDIAAGTGLPNKDFALFVSALDSSTCQSSPDTLGFAHPCMYDQYDRPIMGRINFCPNALKAASTTVSVATAKHEIAHALGFTSERYPYMRWPTTLTPRTPRDATGNPADAAKVCADGISRTLTAPDEGTMASSLLIRSFPNGFKLVTPNLKKAAQEHFGCSTETGIELENQPTGSAGSCWGSHFEQRILHTELMTPVTDEQSVVSVFTLAYFEDTGWYTPDYTKAEHLYFGKDMGCTFITNKCIGSDDVPIGLDRGYFCKSTTTSTKSSCTHDATSKGYCNKIHYTSDLPNEFQYFKNKKEGGALMEMDFCPYYSAYSNGDCRNSQNGNANPKNNYYGDIYSGGSACIKSTAIWTGYTAPASLSNGWEACVGITCNEAKDVASVKVIAEDGTFATVDCAHSDIGKKKHVSKFAGQIVCPDLAIVCAASDGVNFVPSTAACPSNLNNCNDPHGSCTMNEDQTTYKCVCGVGWSGVDCKVHNTVPSPAAEQEEKSTLNGGNSMRSVVEEERTKLVLCVAMVVVYLYI